MGDRRFRFDLYCEDFGHEMFVRALVRRLAGEIGVRASLLTRSGRGGYGRATKEFRLFQRAAGKGLISETPDLLVLVLDANCNDWHRFRSDLNAEVDPKTFPRWVIGCPDPHVERWCFADPAAFRAVVGVDPPADPGKCERLLYKQLLRTTIRDSETIVLTSASEMEIVPDLVAAMDLFKAGRHDRSLGHFIGDLRSAMKELGRS